MGQEAKYIVGLTDEERYLLQQLVVGPRVARDKALRARMLLKADVDGPRRRAGSPSRRHGVQPGAGGACLLDVATAGG